MERLGPLCKGARIKTLKILGLLGARSTPAQSFVTDLTSETKPAVEDSPTLTLSPVAEGSQSPVASLADARLLAPRHIAKRHAHMSLNEA